MRTWEFLAMQLQPKIWPLYLVVLLLPVVGCGQKPAVSPSAGAALANDRQPPSDRSLSEASYLAAGVPDSDNAWSGSDMQQAAGALTAVALRDQGQLPRYESELSGAVFRRMTTEDNLARYRDTTVPLDERLPDALTYMQSSNEILKVYLPAFETDTVSGDEMVELIASQLRVGVVMIELVNEFLPSLDKNDPTYATRMEGLKTMKGGMANMADGSIVTLTESHAYRTAELKRLIGYMKSTLPAILPELPEESSAALVAKLRGLSKEPKMKHLQPELDELLAIAEKSEKPKAE